MKKNIFIIMVIIFFNSCQHLVETLKIDMDLEYNENNKSLILFETKHGCSKTNFKFTEEFNKEIKFNEKYNYFIATNIVEYNNTINRYFEMDFLNTINQEYFYTNNLIFIIVNSLYDGEILKNGRFKKNIDNKYIFEIDVIDTGKPFIFLNKCIYTKIIVLEIGKI